MIYNYMGLVSRVMADGEVEMNMRTGINTARLHGISVGLTSGDWVFSPRKMSPRVAAAEVAWMLQGTHSTEFLDKYTSIWKKFEDRPGVISTAYGTRWRYKFGRDQISEAIKLLKQDPSTRQALVMSWDPSFDGLMNQGKVKNVPCPFSFSLYVSSGKGKMVVYQRSADVIVGIPYDLMSYYMLGQAIFNSVGVKFDEVIIMIGDAHVYQNHYDIASTMIDSVVAPFPHMLDHGFTVGDIVSDPEVFVMAMTGLYIDVQFPLEEKLEAAQ